MDKIINNLDKLDSSKHFCMAPWVHLYILPNLNTLPCCVSPHEDSFGSLKEGTIQNTWNSQKFKETRLSMLNDQPVENCNYCYTLEESGITSMRKQFNENYRDNFEIVKNTEGDGSVKDLKLRYLDFRFSNRCNFKCRGCSPTLSTSWYEDHQKLWDFKSEEQKLINDIAENPQIKTELFEQLKNVKTAYFAGGEPLMMQEHYDCLEYLIEHNLVDVSLSYSTNLSVLRFKKYDLIDLWKKFKSVQLIVSLDEIEERGEYFRSGLEWTKFVENLSKIKEQLPHAKILINCTVSLFNINRLAEIHEFLFSNKFIDEKGFVLNTLVTPECYRMQVLPLNIKKKVRFKLLMYLKNLPRLFPEVDWGYLSIAISNQIKFMMKEDHNDLLKEFKDRTIKLDQIRGEEFQKVFPELAPLLE